jgi:16S rRNA (guanine527-N7)-methyltransferase
MTEDDAKAWLTDVLGVSRGTLWTLEQFQAFVMAENAHQNLVSSATIPHFLARHIVDSAQLWPLVDRNGAWLDLGTGAGFPGIVIAILREQPIVFVESRRKRAEFLQSAIDWLGLNHARVVHARLETLETRTFSVISARAFAPLPRLFEIAHRFSTEKTLWVLPKGQSAAEELETARQTWHGAFHVKQSVTDHAASIIVASQVKRADKANRQGRPVGKI